MVIALYLEELKFRLFYIILGTVICFIIIYNYSLECFYLLAEPYCQLWGSGFFLIINLFEVILSYLKIAFIGSTIYFIIISLVNIWLFIIPILHRENYKKMKKKIYFFIASWIGSMIIIYKYLILMIYMYIIELLNKNNLDEYIIDLELRMLSYIELNIKMLIIFYILLYVPIIVMVIGSYWMRDVLKILKYRIWLYWILLIMIMGLLPPDGVLHLIVWISMLVISEIIVLIILLKRNYKKEIIR